MAKGRMNIGAMKDLPKEEDLGTYHAEAGRFKAELKLGTRLAILGVIDSGSDWYQADARFYTAPQYIGETEGFSVSTHFSTNVLEEIFSRMKSAESGIEELLRKGSSHNENWVEVRDIMRCIFSLEDQTRHLYEERLKAKRARNLLVYGEEVLSRED